jgi:hypothetical protein
VAGDLLRNKATRVQVGGRNITLDLHRNGHGGFIQDIQRLTEVIDTVPEVANLLPRKLAVPFDPRFMDDGGAGFTKSIKSVSNWILQRAGEDVTQVFNRRPAYLDAHETWFRHYKALGLDTEGARALAHRKAVEQVNFIYYNMSNMTPFLRKMNGIVPFFAAAWEVAQTWAYKIPLSQAGGMGAVQQARRIDRVFRGLTALGLLRHEYDPETGESSMWLQASARPETDNWLGQQLSKSGYKVASTFETLVRHLVNMRNHDGVSDVEIEEGTLLKDHVKFQVSHPGDIQGSGIMAVLHASISLNPLGQYAASEILQRIPGVVGEELVTAKAGDTIASLAEASEVDPVEFYRLNRDVLEAALGSGQYRELLAGRLAPGEVEVPEGISLAVPGTTLFETLIDPVMFPFGKTETVGGTLFAMTPAWMQYWMRGWGLWGSNGEGWWDDGNAGGFLEAVATPLSRYQISSEINLQMMHLEAKEGLLTRWQNEVSKLEAMVQADVKKSITIESLGEEGLADLARREGIDPEREAAWNDQLAVIQEAESRIIVKAQRAAGGSIALRGTLGFMSPATPQMVFEEQKAIEAYWTAREAAEDVAAGVPLEQALRGKLPARSRRGLQ